MRKRNYYEFSLKNKKGYSRAINNLEERLASYAAKSKDAVLICSANNSERKINLDKMTLSCFCFRSPYQIDSDKIIYSKYNLLLNGKTQIFIAPSDNQFITRASHTEIVTNLAESIGRGLGLNEDLIKAIAKGHDIGHTAFGHVGEKELDRICKEYFCCLDISQLKKYRPEIYEKLREKGSLDSLKTKEDEKELLSNLPVIELIKDKKYLSELKKDFLLQERDKMIISHSKQSFRFLCLFEGKNLTSQTVYGIIAHNYDKELIYPEISFKFKELIKRPKELGLLHSKTKPAVSNEIYELNSRFLTFEGQVVKFSDFLAFTIHDLDDAIRAGLITHKQLKEEFKERFPQLKFEEYLKGVNRYSKYIITFLDFNKARNIKKKEGAGPIKDENLLIIPPVTYEILNWLSDLVTEKIHSHEMVRIRNKEAKKYVEGLFDYYWVNKDKNDFDKRIKEILPELKTEFMLGGYSDIRKFCDFISGLTDDNIINIYRNIYGPEQNRPEFSLII